MFRCSQNPMFYGLRWNKEGVVMERHSMRNHHQFLRVQASITLAESGDESTSHSQWEVLDLNWTVVFKGAADVKGTRLETPDQDWAPER